MPSTLLARLEEREEEEIRNEVEEDEEAEK
jgi:hypothetical protein